MGWFVVLAVITIGLAIGLPPDPSAVAQLHTTSAEYRLAVGLLLIPYTIIWFFAFFAFSRLQSYSRSLSHGPDVLAFRRITDGMAVLAFGLIIPTAVSLILGDYASYHHSFRPVATMTGNYLSLLVAVLALSLIGDGAHRLATSIKTRAPLSGIRVFMILFIGLGVVFTYLTLHINYNRETYHLPVWWLLITFVLPYLYAWFAGLLGAYDLKLYAGKVRGILYQQGLKRVAYGLISVVAGSVAIQFVAAGLSTSTHLVPVVLIDYVLLIVVVVGLAFMASGAKRLRKIEKV